MGDLLKILLFFKGGKLNDYIMSDSISDHRCCTNYFLGGRSHQYIMDISAHNYCGLDHQEDIL